MSERVSRLFCKLFVSQTAACCLVNMQTNRCKSPTSQLACGTDTHSDTHSHGLWQAVGGKWKNSNPTRTSKSVGNVAVTVVVAAAAAVVASQARSGVASAAFYMCCLYKFSRATTYGSNSIFSVCVVYVCVDDEPMTLSNKQSNKDYQLSEQSDMSQLSDCSHTQ